MLIGGLWRGVHLLQRYGLWELEPQAEQEDEAIADSALAGFGTAGLGLWAIVKAVRNKDDHHPPD
jgi:hypothetical protein